MIDFHTTNLVLSLSLLIIGMCDDGDIRLLTSTEFDDYTVDSTEDLMGGRVEVCHNGRYGAVCDNTWDNIDASVSCAQLGFSPFGNLMQLFKHPFHSLSY